MIFNFGSGFAVVIRKTVFRLSFAEVYADNILPFAIDSSKAMGVEKRSLNANIPSNSLTLKVVR